MGHSLLLNQTCDIGENKGQGHATLPFLKIDMRHWGPPSRAPQRHIQRNAGPANECGVCVICRSMCGVCDVFVFVCKFVYVYNVCVFVCESEMCVVYGRCMHSLYVYMCQRAVYT